MNRKGAPRIIVKFSAQPSGDGVARLRRVLDILLRPVEEEKGRQGQQWKIKSPPVAGG